MYFKTAVDSTPRNSSRGAACCPCPPRISGGIKLGGCTPPSIYAGQCILSTSRVQSHRVLRVTFPIFSHHRSERELRVLLSESEFGHGIAEGVGLSEIGEYLGSTKTPEVCDE